MVSVNWQEHFGNVFFDLWDKAGLPDPLGFGEEYVALRHQAVFSHELLKNTTEVNSILGKNLVNSIYGFGALHGRMFAKLLGLKESEATEAIDWCGRFNLGISTFDYVTDETTNGIDTFNSFEVFQTFKPLNRQLEHSLSPVEAFLMRLSKGVLKDIQTIERAQESNDLMLRMKQLYEAQMFLSKASLKQVSDFDKISDSLYLKSAEPFRVMAEYVAISSKLGPEEIAIAKSLGIAIGKLYWLIDDAKDIWIDLEADDWNLFLLKAFKRNPKLFDQLWGKLQEHSFEKIWNEDLIAQQLSSQMIQELLNTTKKLYVSKEDIKHQLGLLSSALWHWYKF